MAWTSNALSAYFVVRGDEHDGRHLFGASCWITPKPSHAGIWTSRNTRSGCCCWIAETACVPSAYSPTTSMSFS
jgi:hypothetical protein